MTLLIKENLGYCLPTVAKITQHLAQYDKLLSFYNEAFEKNKNKSITDLEITTKLIPTAIIRFQILLIELIENNYISFEEDWNFNILTNNEEIINFADLAVQDLFIWFENLWNLKNKTPFHRPKFNIQISESKKEFIPTTKSINIDFSLFKRYTDENLLNPDVIYVRTDYFDIVKERNYFKVSTAEPINYNITESDKKTLEFFLFNIFDKPFFRDGQFPIIENALNRKDTIGLLPTGGGKSICYQLPCLLQPSINFVVCPIKSLMYDQNENLVNMLITNVAHITSDLEGDVRRNIELDFERGRYLFVWISPEKFQIPSFRDKIRSINSNFSIAYAVVDEVHCLSEWGHDFRTSYLNLAKTIDKLSPKDKFGEGEIKFIGLTATASVNVLKDIKIEFSRQKQKLDDQNIKSLLDYSRKELIFEVKDDNGNKLEHLKNLIKDLADYEDLTETDEKAAIIFTPNVNGAFGCYTVSNFLNTLYPHKSNWYAGDIPKIDEYNDNGYKTGRKLPVMSLEDFKIHKDKVQKGFKQNLYPLMVATKAYGMGIDKQNIHYTLHYGLPSSVESLYQEAGRAGRWDKNNIDNTEKSGKCYILYSPETHDAERVQRLFHKDTSFSEMKVISNEVGFNGKDIFKQIFLFVQGQQDITEDFEITLGVLNRYYQPDAKKQIFWNDAYSNLKINNDVLQKAIYRLSLLGIVADWTTNFVNHFDVEFSLYDDNIIVKNIANYINKYEPDRLVAKEVREVPKSNILEKSIWYLLNWIFENISHNRKQSLKTLMDWCDDFRDNETFKRRIDNYFKFTEITFVLQHVSENPQDFEHWFLALTIIERDSFNAEKNRIYLPEIQNLVTRKEKFENLRDSISRFLESRGNNAGLNFLSGIVRLFIDEFEDSDGVGRFESALSYIKKSFDNIIQDDIINRVLAIGKNLSEKGKSDLCKSIVKFYPEKLEYIAEYFDLEYLLNDKYTQMLTHIKSLNKILHEQLTEI